MLISGSIFSIFLYRIQIHLFILLSSFFVLKMLMRIYFFHLFCYSKKSSRIMKILFRFQKMCFRARKSLSMMMIGVLIWREILTTRVWSNLCNFSQNFRYFLSSRPSHGSNFTESTQNRLWKIEIELQLVAKKHETFVWNTNYSHFTRSISSTILRTSHHHLHLSLDPFFHHFQQVVTQKNWNSQFRQNFTHLRYR